MPLYAYRCPTCACQTQRLCPIVLRDELQLCPQCGKPMQRQVTAGAVIGDYAAYNCPITGKLIEGRRAHEENLRRHGCRVLEVGETQELQGRKAAEEKALDRELDSTVGKLVSAMPAAKRERLAAEMQSGAKLDVSRN